MRAQRCTSLAALIIIFGVGHPIVKVLLKNLLIGDTCHELANQVSTSIWLTFSVGNISKVVDI